MFDLPTLMQITMMFFSRTKSNFEKNAKCRDRATTTTNMIHSQMKQIFILIFFHSRCADSCSNPRVNMFYAFEFCSIVNIKQSEVYDKINVLQNHQVKILKS